MVERLRELHVLLGERHAGLLREERTGSFTFEYDEGYVSDPLATPLSLSLPKVERLHRHRRVLPFIVGLLPDNDHVLERWAREYEVSSRNPFALLSFVGEDCAGAVQFVREDRLLAVQQDGVAWLGADELTDRLRELRLDPTAWVWDDIDHQGRFSLAGAQAKTALFRGSDGRWGRPLGRTPTTHILKIASGDFTDQEINEHVTMRAAALVGLTVARTEILEFGGERVISVERYDRYPSEVSPLRVHQEDVVQALSVMPSKKYQGDGGPGPVEIVRLLRDRVTTDRDRAIGRFVDGLVYNWLVGGVDAHAKNYSLLLLDNVVELAPLYDMASAFPYEEQFIGRGLTRGSTRRRLRGLRLAMTIGGESGIDAINIDNWQRFAMNACLDLEPIHRRIVELAESIPDAVADAGNETRSRIESPVVEMVLDRVARHCRRVLDRVSGKTDRAPKTGNRPDATGNPLAGS